LALLSCFAMVACYTNTARITQRLNTKTSGKETIYVSYKNDSGVPIEPGFLIAEKLRKKGYTIALDPEGADLQLEVVVGGAQWEATGDSSSGGVHGGVGLGISGHSGGGGGGKADLIAFAVVAVAVVAILAVSAAEPKEFLTGTVNLALTRKGDAVPETGAIDLRFSCVSDRRGTVRSAETEIADRILEMF
jgi:hypothetical protein